MFGGFEAGKPEASNLGRAITVEGSRGLGRLGLVSLIGFVGFLSGFVGCVGLL